MFAKYICTCTFLMTKQGTELDSIHIEDEVFELPLQTALTLLLEIFDDFHISRAGLGGSVGCTSD